MRHLVVFRVPVALLLATSVWAAPTVSGVLNGASFAQGSLAPGTIISIFGSGLARSTTSSSTLPLPLALDGTVVTVNGQAIPLFFVSANQINAQLPFQIPTGITQLTVKDASGAIGSRSVTISATSPAMFTVSADGKGEAISVHANFSLVRKVVGEYAKTGETIILFCTGLGALDNFANSGTPAPSFPLSRTAQLPTVLMDGRAAQVTFAGLAPGFIGLYQINIVVPAGVGGDVATSVLIGGVTSNTSTINVSGNYTLAANYSGPLEYRIGTQRYQLELSSLSSLSPTIFKGAYRQLSGSTAVDTGTFQVQRTDVGLFLVTVQSTTFGQTIVGAMDTLDAGKTFFGLLYDASSFDKIADFDNWYATFTIAVSTPAPPPSPPTVLPGITNSCSAVEGLLIYASDGIFLGRVTSNSYSGDSIGNQYGQYGSPYSSTSIFNAYGSYGGEFALKSPFNNFTSSPPILYRNNTAVVYLTTNTSKTPRIDPKALYPCIGK